MAPFQMWLVSTFASVKPIRDFMHTQWAWPAAESVHFIGLSLLFGTIFLFDLRLLGVARRIPIGALHKLVPWGVLGYGLTALSGVLFLMTEPDQYIYNPAFHFKMLFMVTAGLNASAFYLTSYRRVTGAAAPSDAPRLAKVIAAASLCLWIGVIVAGRLLTFYRPFPCGPQGPGFLAECIPYYYGR
jgi:uncharacterized membrane protein